MLGQAAAPAPRVWHPPMVLEIADIVLSPPAAQLVISSRGPRREHTDKEREARLNAEAQARWRARLHDPKYKNREDKRHCCVVEFNALVLDLLISSEWLDDDESGDPKAVGRAISEMLMEAGTAHWKETH